MEPHKLRRELTTALADVILYLEKEEMDGLISSEEREKTARKFTEVVQQIISDLDDSNCLILADENWKDDSTVLPCFSCRMDKGLLPHSRVLRCRIIRKRKKRLEKLNRIKK